MLTTILQRVSPSRSRRARDEALAAMLEGEAAGDGAGPRVLLYHADHEDQEVALEDVDRHAVDERGLLWIDVSGLDDVERATACLGLPSDMGAAVN